MLFFFVALLIFSAAMYAAAHYAWAVPEKEAARQLNHRLRELRASMRGRPRSAPELLRREHRGTFAFLGDLVTWVGVLRRLQEIIDQANLRYRAADVFGGSVLLAALACLVFTLAGGGLLLLRLLVAAVVGVAPVIYITRVRTRRLRKFEE